MTITVTIIVIIAVAVISWIMGFVSAPTKIEGDINPYWDYESKSNRLIISETENYRLREENLRIKMLYDRYYRNEEIDYWRNKKYHAKETEKQEIAEILKTSFVSLEDLAKKLDIDIK